MHSYPEEEVEREDVEVSPVLDVQQSEEILLSLGLLPVLHR